MSSDIQRLPVLSTTASSLPPALPPTPAAPAAGSPAVAGTVSLPETKHSLSLHPPSTESAPPAAAKTSASATNLAGSAAAAAAKVNIASPVCRNCKTQTTPLWRRDETGQVLCNACGLFLKLHGRPRPISLKTDTIKLRNRIKQPNSGKLTAPNTPELKSKHAGSTPTPLSVAKGTPVNGPVGVAASGKKSPKAHKSKKSIGGNGDLTPLLPAAAGGAPHGQSPGTLTPQLTPHLGMAGHHHHLLLFGNSNGSSGSAPGGVLPLPHLLHMHSTPQLNSMGAPVPMGLTGSGMYHTLPHHLQVQPLHYPSSTPAQFAPGLQRITSPLLLSTTSSIRQTSKPLSAAAQAAGALETMSHELGPSATFKIGNGTSLLGGNRKDVSLMTPASSNSFSGESHAKKELSTPSSALNGPLASAAAGSLTGALKPQASVSSPSFGPQFSLQQQQKSAQGTPEISAAALPPIASTLAPLSGAGLPHIQKLVVGGGAQLSHAQDSDAAQQPAHNTISTSGSISASSGGNAPASNGTGNNHNQSPSNHNNTNSSSGDGPGRNPPNYPPHAGSASSQHEITILKTRISELELVNDLYRTRIMELEAMEQAARLREISMRKRLDEIIYIQDGKKHAVHQTAQTHQQSPLSQESPQQFSLPPIYASNTGIKRESDFPEAISKKQKFD